MSNPFTNPDANARLHANANAAFMRATRPGHSGDTGGPDLPGNPDAMGHFGTDGQPHPWQDDHPDQTPVFHGPPSPRGRARFTI